MPQTNSAKKALRQTKKRTAKNLLIKRDLDYLSRSLRKAVSAGDKTKAEEIYKKLIKSLDKAAQKNVLHQNTAARKKSRSAKKVNVLKK